MLHIRPHAGETWRDAVARAAEHSGCAWEALAKYDYFVNTCDEPPFYAANMLEHEYKVSGTITVAA